MKGRRFSIAASMSRIIIFLTAAIVILLNMVGGFMGRQLIAAAQNQVASSIEVAGRNFDKQIGYMDEILGNTVTDDVSFKILGNAYDANDIYIYGREVNINIEDALIGSDLKYYSFVFHSKIDYIHFSGNTHLTDERAAGLYAFVENATDKTAYIDDGSWGVFAAGSYSYLIKIVKYKNAYAGIIIVPDYWEYFEKNLGYDGADFYLLSGDTVVADNTGGIYGSGKYVESVYSFENAPLEIQCRLPRESALGKAAMVSRYVFYFSLILCLFIPFLIRLTRRHLLAPLKMMEDKISNIKYGTEVIPLEEVPAKEAADVFMAFDSLMDEINELKIRAYEEKIAMQSYKLQYLMLQLKPHFYLNFLKAVYALAEGGKYKEIQTMTKAMSEHFRYLVYNDSSIVTLREEVGHAQNYVKIQQMGHMFEIDVNYRVDSDVLGEKVPTLSVQTFVENSIKYAKPKGNTLKINIRAGRLKDEDKEYLDIIISDNGIGYDEKIIEDAAEGRFEKDTDSHLGLSNLYNRLKLLYEDDFYMILGKTKDGGALSELLIPLAR